MFKIAVVIPTMDRPLQLAECLRSLTNSTYLAHRVLVVDASINKITTKKAIIPFQRVWPFKVDYFEAFNASSATQRNQGLSQLEDEDGVLFMDDDIVVEPGCLEEMVTAFSFYEQKVIGVAANFCNQPVGNPGLATRVASPGFPTG